MALCRSVPAIHVMAVVVGSLEIMLFGGVIFGWHSLVYVYKDTRYFAGLCPGDKGSPPTGNVTAHPLPDPSSIPTTTTTTPTAISYGVNASSVTDVSMLLSTTPTTPNKSTGYGTVGPSLKDSEGGEYLSCKEQARAHAEGKVLEVCQGQDNQFNLIFSLSTGINGIMSFPSGYLYDIVGTRLSRIFSLVSFLVGQVCLIFASPSNPYLLYPGFIGLVYGGYQILLTNLQLSCLIPSLRSTIMSLYAGSYDTSASIFLLFKAAYEGGVSVNTSFIVQTSLYVLLFGSTTFFFLPKDRVPFPLSPGYRLRCFLCHKFCGQKTSLQRKSHTSSEWRMDPSGSVILSRFASRDLLDNRQGLMETAPDSKTDLNGSASGKKELRDSGGDDDDDGGGAGNRLSQNEGKMVDRSDNNDDDDAAKELGKDVVSSCNVDNGNVERLPPSDNETTQNSKASPTKRTGPEQNSQEVESILQGGEKKEAKTFRQVALSPLFLTDLMWISVQRLRSWIFVGMFNTWITHLACGDKSLVSHYTSVYAAMQFFGILTAPLSGRLMDRKIKGAEKYSDPRDERLHAAIASFVLNSTVSVLLTVCTLIPVLKLQYLTFVLHCLHRSFLYGPNSAFVANAFPNEHFGKLFGVTLTVSALFSMVQYPLFLIIQGPLAGDPLAINLFLLVLMLISYIHPIYIWRYLQRKVAKASSA